MKNYIDLGLPSGTLFAETNERVRTNRNKLVELYGEENMPSLDQLRELDDNTEKTYDVENCSVKFVSKINGNSITVDLEQDPSGFGCSIDLCTSGRNVLGHHGQDKNDLIVSYNVMHVRGLNPNAWTEFFEIGESLGKNGGSTILVKNK